MQGPGYCYHLGEVGPPPVHSCLVSGHADRHFLREGVSVWGMVVPVSRDGGLSSGAFITTCANLATVAGPHGFSIALSSLGSLVHAPSAVAPQGFLVPLGGRFTLVVPLSLEYVETVPWWLQEDRWVLGVSLQVPRPCFCTRTLLYRDGVPIFWTWRLRGFGLTRRALSTSTTLEMNAVVLALAAFLPQL